MDLEDILEEMFEWGITSELEHYLHIYYPEYEGLRDMINQWSEETDERERIKILCDICTSLMDIRTTPDKDGV